MTTTRTDDLTICTSCEGFDIIRPATFTAQYPGESLHSPATGHETLCDTCAQNTRAYCNIRPILDAPTTPAFSPEEINLMNTETHPFDTPEEPSAAPKVLHRRVGRPSNPVDPAPSIYGEWFQALLDRDEVCTDLLAFEQKAYSGHISYELGGTDGHYAPEPFDAWVQGFRRDPINALYWGNDARHTLAPQANSYTAITLEIYI